MIEKALAVAAKSNIYPRRLRLLTLDPSKFENLISNLRLLNDSILTFLNSHQQKRHTELQERTFVQVLETNNRLDDLQSLLQSFQVSLSPPSQSTEDRRRQMELAQFKMLSMAISEAAKSKSSNIEFLFSTKPLSLEEIHFTEQDDTSARNVSTGKYGGSPIWIEWRDCTHLPMSPSINVVRDRIANLAVLLQGARTLKDFNVPACLGYVDFPTEDRIGLVFRPRQADHSGIPLSLYELLKSRPKPSLTVRIQLARTIATSLWYLHAANWMHKGLRSGNIVFEDAANICSPLLAGFDYSRPAEAGEGTDKATENRIHELYRHPAVQFDVPRDGNYGFRKLHDVYALGVVLFEIGTWQCIEDFLDVGSDDYVRRQDIKEVKGTLLSNQSMERLAGEAGVVFSGCIKFCLEQGGKDIGLWLGDGEYAHREFELRILDALRSINV